MLMCIRVRWTTSTHTRGPSTPLGGVAEVCALRKALLVQMEDCDASPLLVASTKAQAGHLLEAARALEAGFERSFTL